jgi:hypothetical protein
MLQCLNEEVTVETIQTNNSRRFTISSQVESKVIRVTHSTTNMTLPYTPVHAKQSPSMSSTALYISAISLTTLSLLALTLAASFFVPDLVSLPFT